MEEKILKNAAFPNSTAQVIAVYKQAESEGRPLQYSPAPVGPVGPVGPESQCSPLLSIS